MSLKAALTKVTGLGMIVVSLSLQVFLKSAVKKNQLKTLAMALSSLNIEDGTLTKEGSMLKEIVL